MPKIKITSKHKILWRRQLPARGNRWEDCEFLFDDDGGDYDYLAVFDAPPDNGAAYACLRENTILIVTEPPLARLYPNFYVRQFGAVISQPFGINHPRIIQSHGGLCWWYGKNASGKNRHAADYPAKEKAIGFDELAAMPPPQKSETISTVCSNLGEKYLARRKKKLTLAFHAHRLAFTRALKRDLPQLEFFGAGTKPVDDKAEAIDNYKYHLAVENYCGSHWWTEKLADAYLGYALPIYHGCPNLGDYFPKESFLPINIYNYPEALRIIRRAIGNGEYEKRLPAIVEARRRLLYEHNIFALLARAVKHLPAPQPRAKRGGEIVNLSKPKLFSGLGGIKDYWEYRALKRKRNLNIKRMIAGVDVGQWG